MGAFSISSRYTAPHLTQQPVESHDELLQHDKYFRKGVTLAKGFPVIKPGDLLSRISSGTHAGKFRRYGTCQVAANAASGDSVISLKDGTLGNALAPAFVVGEIVNIGAVTNKTIVAVDNTLGKITISGTLGAGVTAGDTVDLATPNGCDVAVCVAARPIGPGTYSTASPDINFLLDVDYLVDAYFQAILKRSMLRGLDAGAITDLAVQSLAPTMDAAIIR